MGNASKVAIAAMVMAITAAPVVAETAAKPKGAFTAEPIVVDHREVVEPDADLQAFLVELSRMVATHEPRPDLFAAPIRVFVRPADPLAPLVEKKPATSWNDLHFRMKEAGETPPPGGPDRDRFLARLAAGLGGDDPLGRVAGLGDAVCEPAELAVDTAAVRAALTAIGGDARSLRYSTEPVPFRTFAPGPTIVELSPGTLLMREPLPRGGELPRDPRFVLTDGRKGSVPRAVVGDETWRSLRRGHTCFGKVNGAWKVTAVVFAGPD